MEPKEIIAIYQPAPPAHHTDFETGFWKNACPLEINRNWRGEIINQKLRTTVRIMWTSSDMYFGFECSYTELDMDDPASAGFDISRERFALWDRDACEVFINSPAEKSIQIYREFEAAPNGQWCDLKVNRLTRVREWEWQSGMKVFQEIREAENCYHLTIRIPFTSFETTADTAKIWKANIFRITRTEGARQYLTLSPTMTDKPNYHVPEKFIDLTFKS